ncbi:COG4648 family protein [Cellvibrio fibrivorans]|uniref:Membrane protein n=1 Tax=Cellvibrio fibrivorans TaxID=126350 RepID=A0ABU1UUJ5_9GAMM|nr:hypothetical protein [Cellvibrio fibrivorans]MDR7088798.1 putative membrane protein [Cellvibrio fibrivorans]
MLNRVIAIALIAAYPLLVHVALVFTVPQLLFIAPMLFLAGVCWQGLVNRNKRVWLVFSMLCTGIALLEYLDLTLYLLFLPPVVIPLLLLFIFGRTLISGREPLITAIGEAARGPLSNAMRSYTRGLTQLWCVVFVAMIVWSAILPWLEQPELWSWFTNIINYGVVGVLFVGEFMLRKKLFPSHNHPGFFEYLRIIAHANIRS